MAHVSDEAEALQTISIRSTRFRRSYVDNAIVVALGVQENDLLQLSELDYSTESFTNRDECADFISDTENERILLIVSEQLSDSIVPIIHDKSAIQTIYIFCTHTPTCVLFLSKSFLKINHVCRDISSIRKALVENICYVNHNLTPITVLPAASSSMPYSYNTLNTMFMYCQLLKQTFSEIEYGVDAIKALVELCKRAYAGNATVLRVIDEFYSDYERHSPVWWYTRDCFIYRMLNKALRIHNIEIITKFGFFIKDLHRQLELFFITLPSETFSVYRGQSISNADFTQLRNGTNGLLSFNNFLSTSLDRDVAVAFALPSLGVSNVTAVLFTILVDQTITSSRFASLCGHSYVNAENEVLFGMSSVFRLGEITQMDNGLWEISMILTCDTDPQLMQLTDYMKATVGEFTGVPKLAQLLARMGAWDTGTEIYEILLATTDKSNVDEIAHIQNQLGYLAWQKNELDLALTYYEQSLSNRTNRQSSRVALTYRNIGLVLRDKGEHDKALEYYQDALAIDLGADPPNQEQIAYGYHQIGVIYQIQGLFNEAQESYDRALEIRLKHLPSNHPHFGTGYVDIGGLSFARQCFSEALTSYKLCFTIYENSLPPYHHNIAVAHYNISVTHSKLEQHVEAFEHAKQALDIALLTMSPKQLQLQLYRKHFDSMKTKLEN
ncbi:unnamed protein product [Rotaria socialis]|uniref:Uncharacterized protein n=2 Tax=Rotaria socialis TaxID=392032 RepID=A0A818XQJ0_9BILA|nr:unnamed protein product [Rotaria socialis]CAF4472266.1 unnamed protein product [Rotaria socialis]CAF4693479.1 unnamed protein product [Rotaria socialis]